MQAETTSRAIVLPLEASRTLSTRVVPRAFRIAMNRNRPVGLLRWHRVGIYRRR